VNFWGVSLGLRPWRERWVGDWGVGWPGRAIGLTREGSGQWIVDWDNRVDGGGKKDDPEGDQVMCTGCQGGDSESAHFFITLCERCVPPDGGLAIGRMANLGGFLYGGAGQSYRGLLNDPSVPPRVSQP